MAVHEVTIDKVPRLLVGGNNLVFEVREEGNKLGILKHFFDREYI